MSKPTPVRLTVSLPPDDYERVRDLAERMRVSLAWVVREAVTEYMATPETESGPSSDQKSGTVPRVVQPRPASRHE